MSATDELRRMLDERWVAWDELQDCEGGEMTRGRDIMGRYVTAYDDGVVTFFADFYWGPTPQQAIDATLGRGACEVVSRPCDMWECECGKAWWHGGMPNFCPNCGAKVVDE